LSAVNRIGHGLLERAIASGNIKAVAVLLAHGLDIHYPTRGRLGSLSIPLWTAISQGDAAMVEFLLSQGADRSWRSCYEEDAVGFAQRIAALSRIQELLRQDPTDGTTGTA
jgi:ankyrin repeat protein